MDYRNKIKKLLSLAESPNENEAKAALLKARQLMAEHKIIEGDLNEDQEVKTILTDITFTEDRNPWFMKIVCVISEHHCCRAFREHRKSSPVQRVGLIGFPEDLEICNEAIRYTLKFVLEKIEKVRLQNQSHSLKYIRMLADSYGYGFARGLMDAFECQQKENEEGWGLALAIPDEVSRAASGMGQTPFRSHAEDAISAKEYVQGHTEGKGFDLKHRIETLGDK